MLVNVAFPPNKWGQHLISDFFFFLLRLSLSNLKIHLQETKKQKINE